MNSYRLVFFVLMFCTIATKARASLLGRFLSATTSDSLAITRQNHTSSLEKAPFSIPFIKDVEFRIRNRAFDLGGQRYTIKLEPRGLGENRAMHEFWKAQELNEKNENFYDLNEELLLNYIYFIDMLERKSLASGYGDLIPIYEDRITVMEQLSKSTDFDLTDLVKTEKDFARFVSEQIEEEQEVVTANRYMWRTIGDSLAGSIDTVGIIAVDEIKSTLGILPRDIDENNIYLKNLKSKYDYSLQRFNLEKSQSRNLLSFLEFSYDHGSFLEEDLRRDNRKDYNMANAYLIEAGIKLPFLSSKKEDIARRSVEVMNDHEEFIKLKKELSAKIIKDREDIDAYIKRYDYLTRRETEADAEASLKKYLEMSGVEPLTLLAIKENLIKNRMEKEKLYFSILRNYIYVMDVNGKLIERPLRNYLSSGKELLE